MATVVSPPDRLRDEPGPCTDRVARLREHYFTFRPAICVERALAYTRSYRETEGLATGMRRATALKRVCAEKSVTILDDELIVGMPAFQPRGAVVCPEISWRWLEAELDTIATREQDPYDITDEQQARAPRRGLPLLGRALHGGVLPRQPARGHPAHRRGHRHHRHRAQVAERARRVLAGLRQHPA